MAETQVGAGHTGDIRTEALEWLNEHWDPELTVRHWWRLLAESGWGFPTWPPEWFGRGLPPEAAAPVREAFTIAGAIGPPASLGQQLGGPTVLTHGTDRQKAQFLPELARGEDFWCQFFSEPDSGSDLASLQTRAVRDGDEWVINGQKVWTSGAQYADRGMLAARTNRDLPKHQGITYFIIDIDQPGIEVRPLHQMNGEHGFNEVFFSDARVGNDRVIGELDGGWSVAVTTLMFERFMTAIPSADPGRKLGLLDTRAGDVFAGKVSGERETASYADAPQLIIDLAHARGNAADLRTRQQLAHVWTLQELNRIAGMRQADAVRSGSRPGAEGSLRKLARSVLARGGRDVGMHVLGAYGTVEGPRSPGDGVVQQLALSSPGASIAGGTDEIQRNIVAERVLGLPKEPTSDRNTSFHELKIGTQTSTYQSDPSDS